MVEGSRSLEEVLAVVVRLGARLVVAEARIVELEAEDAKLRRRVGLSSSSSSKPPSSDGLGKAPPVSLRVKTGRKRGGQLGHEPGRLAQVEYPDHVVVHRPARCGAWRGTLGAHAPEAGDPVVRQVFDLPEIRVFVTGHRMLKVACGCGHATREHAPADAAGPVNLGHRIAATAAYLHAGQMIPVARVAETIRALTGGAWRRWSPANVVLAPGLAVVVLLAALAYVDLWTAYIGSDVGVYVTLVIQLGLLALWLGASRRHRRA